MSYKIYVGQLSDQTTEESLRHVFGEFGEVKHVELRTGFAFVTFESEDDMQRAIDDMNDKELDGSRIRVERERGTTEGGFRGTDGRIKPPRRLDLRVLIRGLHPKVDWKDLKDWARDTVGEVTYSNVFVRDGQHMGLIEMKDEASLDRALASLGDVPLLGVKVSVERDSIDSEFSRIPPAGIRPAGGFQHHHGRGGHGPRHHDFHHGRGDNHNNNHHNRDFHPRDGPRGDYGHPPRDFHPRDVPYGHQFDRYGGGGGGRQGPPDRGSRDGGYPPRREMNRDSRDNQRAPFPRDSRDRDHPAHHGGNHNMPRDFRDRDFNGGGPRFNGGMPHGPPVGGGYPYDAPPPRRYGDEGNQRGNNRRSRSRSRDRGYNNNNGGNNNIIGNNRPGGAGNMAPAPGGGRPHGGNFYDGPRR